MEGIGLERQPYVIEGVAYLHGVFENQHHAYSHAMQLAPALGVREIVYGHLHSIQSATGPALPGRAGPRATCCGFLGDATQPVFRFYIKGRPKPWETGLLLQEVADGLVSNHPVRIVASRALFGGKVLAECFARPGSGAGTSCGRASRTTAPGPDARGCPGLSAAGVGRGIGRRARLRGGRRLAWLYSGLVRRPQEAAMNLLGLPPWYAHHVLRSTGFPMAIHGLADRRATRTGRRLCGPAGERERGRPGSRCRSHHPRSDRLPRSRWATT